MALEQINNFSYGNNGLEACFMKTPVLVKVDSTIYDELKERGIEPWFVDRGMASLNKV